MPAEKRSLYQCSNARANGMEIYCREGHRIGKQNAKTISLQQLKLGRPLECGECQKCPHYVELGPPVPAEERGWS